MRQGRGVVRAGTAPRVALLVLAAMAMCTTDGYAASIDAPGAVTLSQECVLFRISRVRTAPRAPARAAEACRAEAAKVRPQRAVCASKQHRLYSSSVHYVLALLDLKRAALLRIPKRLQFESDFALRGKLSLARLCCVPRPSARPRTLCVHICDCELGVDQQAEAWSAASHVLARDERSSGTQRAKCAGHEHGFASASRLRISTHPRPARCRLLRVTSFTMGILSARTKDNRTCMHVPR